MNNDCDGDIFTRWGKRWGRCFAGGELFELKDGTQYCPVCDRPWEGSEGRKDFNPDESTEVLLKLDLPQLRYMVEQKDRKMKHLEALLKHWQKMYYEAKGMECP